MAASQFPIIRLIPSLLVKKNAQHSTQEMQPSESDYELPRTQQRIKEHTWTEGRSDLPVDSNCHIGIDTDGHTGHLHEIDERAHGGAKNPAAEHGLGEGERDAKYSHAEIWRR